ncbi:MAG: hypothetical protein U1F43_36235 [Myxococcota bacterium]
MGDFRDQLLKAGLVSAEQAKQAEAKERQERADRAPRQPPGGRPDPRNDQRPKGPPRPPSPRDGERQRGPAGPAGLGDPQRERSAEHAASEQQRAQSGAAPKLDGEAALRARQIALSGKLDGRFRGQRRWYYTSRRGVVPYLELNDEAVGLLESGGAGLAEAANGEAWLVTAECAQKLREVGGEWLRLWNRAGEPGGGLAARDRGVGATATSARPCATA